MKRLSFTALFVFLAVILFTGISYADVLSSNIENSLITLGSESQEASNYNSNPYGEYVTTTIIFNTTDTITLSVVPIGGYVQSSSTIVMDNINVSITGQIINTGNSVVSLSARIPENLHAVDTIGDESAFKVAELTFNDGNQSVVIDLNMQRQNKLEFKKIWFTYDQTEDEETIKNGEKINDLKPGDSGVFEFEIENTYTSSDDVEIDSVDLFMYDDRNDLDIDEDESLGTIRDSDDDTESIPIDLDDDLDEGTYKLILKTIGFDDYGARHGEQYIVYIKVEKEDDEITINRLDISPSSLDVCEEQYVTINVRIENTGNDRQKDAAISVANSKFDYLKIIDDIDLDDGDATTKSFFITVPKDVSPGSYKFLVKSFYDNNEESDSQEVALFVRNCNYLSEPDQKDDKDDEKDDDTQIDVQIVRDTAAYSDITYAHEIVDADEDEDNDKGILSTNIIILIIIVVMLVIINLVIALYKK